MPGCALSTPVCFTCLSAKSLVRRMFTWKVVRRELGRYPIMTKAIFQTLNYWFHVIESPKDSLVRMAYDEIKTKHDEDRSARRAFTSLRISSHKLGIEVGRYKGIPPEKRLCHECQGLFNLAHINSKENLQTLVMDRASRAELMAKMDAQEDELQKYKSKLRDLITAYKGIIKEKEALEATVKVLNASRRPQPSEDPVIDDPLNLNSSRETTDANTSGAVTDDDMHALSASITSLTEEKTRMEVTYIAEKKQLKQEIEDLQARLDKESKDSTAYIGELCEQLNEIKGRIRVQQNEREKEQTDHAVMLRELQKLLAEERTSREQLEHQIDESKSALKFAEGNASILDQYEQNIQDLNGELKHTKSLLKDAQQQAKQPPTGLLELQQKVREIQAHHRVEVLQEQQRANKAEESIRAVTGLSEDRVASLELKIFELSEVIGNYERLRYQDQQVITRFKERVTQLDIENTALAQAMRSTVQGQDMSDTEEVDVQSLGNKFVQLMGQLRIANESADKPIDVNALLCSEDLGQPECPLCQQLKDDLHNVTEEFERYKLRAHSVLKNKNKTDNVSVKEIDTLKSQVTDLKEKIRILRSQGEECEAQYKLKIEELRRTMLSMQEGHKLELFHVTAEHKQTVSEIEGQLKKQRDRTISLLAEKDHELERFRMLQSPQDIHASPWSPGGASPHYEASPFMRQQQDDSSVATLLHGPEHAGDSSYLHFSQELARKDVEINGLRKHKKQLESGLRELQFSSSSKDEKYQDEISALQEQIRKRERDISREGANLEYLKNVTYRFLTSHDDLGKQQMLKAIMAILQFSPVETKSVQSPVKGWWG